MVYYEESKDIFTVDGRFYIAHCISADFALGAGIAKKIDDKYDVRRQLLNAYQYMGVDYYRSLYHKGYCIKTGKVLNLVTKNYHYEKPTYETMEYALRDMLRTCIREKIHSIAMPTIGCGLDKLNWDKVKNLIFKVFMDSNIEILVCRI